MRRRRHLSVLLLVALLYVSCSRVETFNAVITGLSVPSDSNRTIDLLKLDPPSRSGRTLFLSFAKDPSKADEIAQAAILWIGEEPGLHDREIKLISGDAAMEPKDLRIGQELVVNYSRYPQSKVETGPLEIKNYVPPSKFLKLTISIVAGTKENPPEYSTEGFESLITTKLSWRLPADVGFILGDEAPNGGSIIGNVDVKYTAYTETTQWTYRKTARKEFLVISTQMSDPAVTSTWIKIKAVGGSEPIGQGAFDYEYKDPFIAVPVFTTLPLQ